MLTCSGWFGGAGRGGREGGCIGWKASFRRLWAGGLPFSSRRAIAERWWWVQNGVQILIAGNLLVHDRDGTYYRRTHGTLEQMKPFLPGLSTLLVRVTLRLGMRCVPTYGV